MEKKDIYIALKNLSREEKIRYGIICMKRIIDLYNIFDVFIANKNVTDLNNLSGFKILNNILQDIEVNINNLSDKDLLIEINNCIKLIPVGEEYEGYEASIAQNVAGTMLFILKFYKENNDRYIELCTDNIIEIINNLRSTYFRKNEISGCSEREYKINSYQQEYQIELNIIEMIRSHIKYGLIKKYAEQTAIKIE